VRQRDPPDVSTDPGGRWRLLSKPLNGSDAAGFGMGSQHPERLTKRVRQRFATTARRLCAFASPMRKAAEAAPRILNCGILLCYRLNGVFNVSIEAFHQRGLRCPQKNVLRDVGPRTKLHRRGAPFRRRAPVATSRCCRPQRRNELHPKD